MRTGIALGSNLGDRLANLRAGRDFLLSLHEGPTPAAVSPVYETTPIDCPPGSPAFLNAVLEINTHLEPAELLAQMSALEKKLGRQTSLRPNAPRPLDLDLLYCDDRQLHHPQLTLPHPRLTTRRFVLEPLAAISPDLVLPGHTRTIADYLHDLPPDPSMRPVSW